MIDGLIDADKLDYLIRDSNNLSVPYGKCIDFERLLRCLTVVFKQESTETFITLGIHEKGKIPAEALSFARYAMFGSVYWHHTSRSVKSMLHRALWEALPKTDRRSKEYQRIKDEFLSEVLRESEVNSTFGTQESLLFNEKKSLSKTPQLNIADYEMLLWIYQKTSDSGKKLLEMICERRLFKRLLVMSERKNSPLWEKLSDLRKNYQWQTWLEFQSRVQDSIVKIIESVDDRRRTSSILAKENTDDIIDRAKKGEVLFLVDIPADRRGSSIDLYYMPESRICGPLPSTIDNIQMEDSLIWTGLSKNFLKSVGKIRVFCHPDIIETCTACLTRSDIESAMEAACRSITG